MEQQSLDHFRTVVCSCLREVGLHTPNLDLDDHLSQYGLDSLQRVHLIFALERKLGEQWDLSSLGAGAFTTISNLVVSLQQMSSEKGSTNNER